MRKIFLILFIFPLLSEAQIICTFAGTGIPSATTSSGYAISTPISPLDLAHDNAGNLYISTVEIIRKIDATGYITTFAGNGGYGSSGDGGPATSAEINFPAGIAVDNMGNVYIAEVYGAKIRKVNAAGIISTIAGNGIVGFSGDGGPATSAELHEPRAVAVDRKGNVYIADSYNNRIRKVDTAGIITTIAGDGYPGYYGDSVLATTAKLNFPYGLATDDSGNIYIPDDFRIRKITTSGMIYTIAGNGISGYSGDGGPATSASLSGPYGVTVDRLGNVFMSDFINNNVRKISTSGIISTITGNGVVGYSGDGGFSTLAEIDLPYGIAVDTMENVYVSDADNYRVRIIEVPKITITGSGDTICYGNFLHFNAHATNVCDSHYQWKINSALVGTDSSSFTTNSLSNNDTVYCTLTTSIGDTIFSTSNKIIVSVKPVATLSSSLNPPVVCDSTLFNYVPTSLSAGTIFSWGRPAVAGISNPSASGIGNPMEVIYNTTNDAVAVSYVYTLVATNGCKNIDSVSVTVDPEVKAVISGSSTICVDSSMNLDAIDSGGTWSMASSIATVSAGTVTGVSPGRDTVLYVISNICGTATAVFPIIILDSAQCNTMTRIPVIANVPSNTINTYPNPAHNELIVTSTKEITAIYISNLLGQVVFKQRYSDQEVTLNITSLPSGVYFISVNNLKSKFIKE